MVFDGTYFNDAHIAGMSLDKFLLHEKHTMPEGKLREVYQLCKILHNGNSEKPASKIEGGKRRSNSKTIDK